MKRLPFTHSALNILGEEEEEKEEEGEEEEEEGEEEVGGERMKRLNGGEIQTSI